MERRGITWARYFLLPGFCGGLTTFSSVALESMNHPHENFIFIAANVVGSLVAVAITLPLSRKWIKVKV
ncbi:Putative fluoride ion transporter CrcB [Candidatus Nanopelagicaceae bacterium]